MLPIHYFRCFACNRLVKTGALEADTRDGQIVYVGPECYVKVVAAGEKGYQPPRGGPRLYQMVTKELSK